MCFSEPLLAITAITRKPLLALISRVTLSLDEGGKSAIVPGVGMPLPPPSGFAKELLCQQWSDCFPYWIVNVSHPSGFVYIALLNSVQCDNIYPSVLNSFARQILEPYLVWYYTDRNMFENPWKTGKMVKKLAQKKIKRDYQFICLISETQEGFRVICKHLQIMALNFRGVISSNQSGFNKIMLN